MDAAYIQNTMGLMLADACAHVARLQPEDPIEWLGAFLRHSAELAKNEDRRKEEAAARTKLLVAAAAEEERLRRSQEEEQRLLAARRPNEHQLQCQAYLEQVAAREEKMKIQHPDNEAAFGVTALTAVSTDLSRLELTEEARTTKSEPPEAVAKIIRGGLILCGYAPSKLRDWAAVHAIVSEEYSLRRYETYELLDRVTDARLKAATKAVEGVDFQSRKLQKHALGPLATRFHTYIRAAIAAMGKDVNLFFNDVTLEEDGVADERRVWSFPQQDGVFADSDEDLEMTRLCVLEGLNHARLPQDLTAQKMMLDIFWACAHGTDTDVDASLIMFDGSGAVCDSVYHLISNSKDGSILHKGDVSGEHDAAQGGDAAQGTEAAETKEAEDDGKEVGDSTAAKAPGSGRASHASHPTEEEEDMETFEFRLQHTDPKVRVIAVVLNVATDNEDLKYVHRCGLRIRVPGASPADVLDTIADFDLTTRRLNSGHEILLALLYRDKADHTQWHLTGVGELVQGEERAKEPSQNFMNALPLAMYYTRKLGILDSIEGTHTVTFNPFRMLPGDKMVVPEMAIEHPVVIGMGWDVDPDVQMDLDCGLAVYCDARRTDYCDFEKLISNDKAIEHQGDNRDGEGEGDDEQIIIQFTKIDPQSDTLFLYAAVYEGGALKDVQNVHIRMLTQRNGKVKEICRFSLDWLAKVADDTAVILAKITRKDHQWEFCTIGQTAVGRTIEELEGRLANYL